MVSDSQLLRFPTDYPIKVLGRPTAEFRARVHAIVVKHAPTLDASRVSERLSGNGNFLSISYLVHAESREQVVAIATELADCPEVIMLI